MVEETRVVLMNLQLDLAKKTSNRRVVKMNDLRAHRLAVTCFLCSLLQSIDAKHVENHRAVGKL